MGLNEKFLVDTSSFSDIVEKLRTVKELPEKINQEYLTELGYSDPPDLLSLIILRELKLLKEDHTPTELFERFRESENGKEVFAFAIIQSYSDLFKANNNIHRSDNRELIQVLREELGTAKSDIILRYMANTFKVLVNYAGVDEIDSALKREEEDVSTVEHVIQDLAEKYYNGSGDTSHLLETIVAEPKNSPEEDQQEMIEDALSDEIEIEFLPEDAIEEEPDAEEDSDDVFGIGEEQDDIDNTLQKDTETAENKNETEADVQEYNTGSNVSNNQKHSNSTGATHNKTREDMMTTIESTHDIQYVDKAFIKRAAMLYKLERYEQALPALNGVYNRFSSSDDPELYNHASSALVKKMEILEKLELNNELVPTYNKLINRLDDEKNSRFAEKVDHAYIKKAEILMKEGTSDEALDAISGAIDRFRNTGNKRDFLAKMMYRKAEILEHSGRDNEALEAYEELLEEFDQE